MPECEYFTTGGCISPFNCLYKMETSYINTATSQTERGMMIMTDEEMIENLRCVLADVSEQCKQLQTENAELKARLENAIEIPFCVIDKKIGKGSDGYKIALNEEWAKDLMYCDIDGFAVKQDGSIILIDKSGSFRYCPADRFEIISEARLAEFKGEKK